MSKGQSVTTPAKFEKVIQSKNILVGDVMEMRGGTYKGNWIVNVPGTFKPYNKEKVVIDGSLTLAQPNTRFVDVEIMDSNKTRTPETITPTITMNMAGCELIGCHIHDLHGSGVNWFGAGVGRIAECWIENNGYYETDGSGHGHAIYSHNHQGGTHYIERNLFCEQIGRYSIHVFSGGKNYLKDFAITDNVINNHPVHTGGGLGLLDFIYSGNIQYGDYCQHGRYGIAERGQIKDNLFFDVGSYYVNAEWKELTETGNEVYGGEPKERDGYKWSAYPKEFSKFIPFILSERWAGIQVNIKDGVFDAVIVPVT
jgi:hypothetical protein